MKAMIYACMLLLLLGCTSYLAWPITAINIQADNKQCFLAEKQLILQWRHSVEHQLWQEHYHVTPTQLHLYQTFMQTFGAGTPSQGQEVKNAPKGFVGMKTHLTLPQLDWVVSRNMQGQIITATGSWHIANVVPDYTAVHIQPMRLTRIQLWLGENCHEFQ